MVPSGAAKDEAMIAVSNLLAVIKDADASAERLAELKAEHDEVARLADQNHETMLAIKAERAAVEERIAAGQGVIDEIAMSRRQLETESDILKQRDAALTEREKAVVQREVEAKARQVAAGEQENAVYHREQAVEAREQEAAATLEESTRIKTEYEGRLKRLGALAAGSEVAGEA